MKILVLNGPNLNLLGIRQPEIYGDKSYTDLCEAIYDHAAEIGISVKILQSNHEGEMVDIIQAAREKYDGIVLNAAAYTHTSVALLDALLTVGLPTVEVHLTDLAKRDKFRQTSFIRQACFDTVMGLGFDGYLKALDKLKEKLQ